MTNAFIRGLRRLFGIKRKKKIAPYGSIVRPVLFTDSKGNTQNSIKTSFEKRSPSSKKKVKETQN